MERDVYRQMAEIQDKHWWYEGRRRILRSVIGRLNLSSSSVILEAGCGPGANLGMLKEFGTVQAFEPDDAAREHAQSISGLQIEKGMMPAPLPFSGPFDLVGAFDVIEHIDDDQGSLSALLNIIKSGGHAIFTVPAFQFLWSPHDNANHHKRRYTRSQFRTILIDAGYDVEFISYYNTILFPIIAVVRLIKNRLMHEEKSDIRMPQSSLINNVLRFIFECEKYILRYITLPFGVSIIAVCRRRYS